MPIKILMPALSPTMTEGNIAKWHKKPGDKVKAGDVIAEIETDKATMEVESADEGILGKILVADGTQNVAVNSLIGILLEEGETEADMANMGASATAPDATAAPAKEEAKAAAAATAAAPARAAGERVFASPLAKRIAEQNNIDLSTVAGSGPNGRIIKTDVEGKSSGGSAAASRSAPTASGPAANVLADQLGQRYTAQPNSNVRKVIARRLLESKQTVPHFYLTVDCRIDKLLALRAELNASGDIKVSVNDLVIKATANALKKVPAANASWTDEAILQYESVDISVAVAGPNGLITPIVKNANNKTIKSISSEMKDLAGRARDGKLKPEEFQGGGFSISNLGMYGISHFAAIINPPQACILAVGAGEKKPVVEGDKIVVGTVMSATLSVDHRAVDGAVGAEFLSAFKALIENPVTILA